MTVPAIAQTEQQPAPIAQKQPREYRPSAKIRKAIAYLEDGTCGTQRAASERVGCSESQLSRVLRNPQIQAFIAKRRAENISRAALRASRRIGQLVDADSEHVALRASERLLETSGDLKISGGSTVNVQVNNHLSPGYVIDLTRAKSE